MSVQYAIETQKFVLTCHSGVVALSLIILLC